MSERRRHQRHRAAFPVQIDGDEKKDRIGVARNASISGVLVGTPSRFSAGERVTLSLKFVGEPDLRVRGRIVRIDADKRSDWFNRILAVAFDEAVPELELLLDAAEQQQSALRGSAV